MNYQNVSSWLCNVLHIILDNGWRYFYFSKKKILQVFILEKQVAMFEQYMKLLLFLYVSYPFVKPTACQTTSSVLLEYIYSGPGTEYWISRNDVWSYCRTITQNLGRDGETSLLSYKVNVIFTFKKLNLEYICFSLSQDYEISSFYNVIKALHS